MTSENRFQNPHSKLGPYENYIDFGQGWMASRIARQRSLVTKFKLWFGFRFNWLRQRMGWESYWCANMFKHFPDGSSQAICTAMAVHSLGPPISLMRRGISSNEGVMMGADVSVSQIWRISKAEYEIMCETNRRQNQERAKAQLRPDPPTTGLGALQ